jgi:RNA polymerase sigma factor (sigma-70 family)
LNIPEDKILLKIFNNGHQQKAIEGFYRKYSHLVFGVCLKYLKNRENSLDATSDIFSKLAEKINKYEIENFNSWIYTLSKNHCLMILRKKASINSKLQFNNEAYSVYPEEEQNLNNYETALMDAILKLNTKQQNCIRLFYFERKSYSEISEITGYTEKEVKSFLQNGKIKLRKILNKQKP